MVTICTTSLTSNNSTFCPHSVFMCFVWIWEQTAIISLYSIDWLVCVTETVCLLRGTDWTFNYTKCSCQMLIFEKASPYIDLSPVRHVFDPRPVSVTFVMDQVTLTGSFVPVIPFPSVPVIPFPSVPVIPFPSISVIPPMLRTKLQLLPKGRRDEPMKSQKSFSSFIVNCGSEIYKQSNKIHKVILIIELQSCRKNFVPAGRVQQYAYYHIPKSAHAACTKRSWWWTDEVRNISS